MNSILEHIRDFPIEHELMLKFICWTLVVVLSLFTLYNLVYLIILLTVGK